MSYAPKSSSFKIDKLSSKNIPNINTLSTMSEELDAETIDRMNGNYVEPEIIEPDYQISDCVIEESDCFNGTNVNRGHYGGNQGELLTSFMYDLIDDYRYDKVIETLKKYFPTATEEDALVLLQKINDVGCGYTGAVNTLFATNLDPEKFEEAFGFTLTYTDDYGNEFYNYELLLLDFFLFYGEYHHNFHSLDQYVTDNIPGSEEELYKMEIDLINQMFGEEKYHYGDIIPEDVYKELEERGLSPGRGMSGTVTRDVADAFKVYLEQHGYEVEVESYMADYTTGVSIDVFKQALEEGKFVVVDCGPDFEFYYGLDTNGDGKYNDFLTTSDGMSGHAVMVVGTTPDGNLVVTSWGQVYIIDPKYVDGYSIYNYH